MEIRLKNAQLVGGNGQQINNTDIPLYHLFIL
jgi:hypothetical protein